MTKTQKLTRTILSSVALLVLCDVAGESILISGAQAQTQDNSTEGVLAAPQFKTPGLQEKWLYIHDRINDGTLRTGEGCIPQLPQDDGTQQTQEIFENTGKSFSHLGEIIVKAVKNNSDKYKKFKIDFAKLPKQESLKTLQEWRTYLTEQESLLSVLNQLVDNVGMDVNVRFLYSISGCKPGHESALGILNNTSPQEGYGSGFTIDDVNALLNDKSWYPLFDDFYFSDIDSPYASSVDLHKDLLPLQQGIDLAKSKIAELGGGNAPGGEQGAGSDQQNKAPFGCDQKAVRSTDIVNGELDKAIDRFKDMNDEQRASLPSKEKDLYGAKLDFDLKKQQYDAYYKLGPDGSFGPLPTGVQGRFEIDNNLQLATKQLKDSCKDLDDYFAKKGRGADGRVLNIDVQPVFLMSAAEFTQRYGGGSPQLLPEENTPTPAFQYSDTIPCGKLSPQVVGRIVKGADKMKPGNSTDIKAFKTALDATFNQSDSMKPIGSKFYDNLVEWIEDKSMTDEKHQLLNYTINQLDILTSSEPKDVFDFSKVYSEYNKTIGNDAIVHAQNGDFQKGWMDFYNDTLKNSKERNIDALYRLMMNMYYTRINKGEPQDSPSMQAMKRIIDKLQGLHLQQKCSKK